MEHANLRAALDWSLTAGADETAAGNAAALYPFWDRAASIPKAANGCAASSSTASGCPLR